MHTTGQRTKILFVVTQGCWGGAQKYVYDLSCALKPIYDIVVASGTEDDKLARRLEAAGIRYIPLPHMVRSISPVNDFRALNDLIRLIRIERPDIVHTNSSKAGVLGSLAAKFAGNAKSVFTIHGLVLAEPLSAPARIFYTIAEKISAYAKDILIAVSEADKWSALRYGLKPLSGIAVIHNGIDGKKIDFLPAIQAREKLGQACGTDLQGTTIIGTIADFYATKGLSHLVRAASSLLAERGDLRFIVLGREGGEKSAVEEQARHLGISDRFFISDSFDDAARYLTGFDIFCLPSVKEGLPYTILEAMAAGLPIVATTVGGIPDAITDGSSGLLVPPASPEEIAAAIKKLVNDPPLSARLGAAAKLRSEDFTLARMAEQTRNVYEKLTQ